MNLLSPLDTFDSDDWRHDIFGADGACPILIEPGDSRTILISGENGCGKSLLARALGVVARRHNIALDKSFEVMRIGMELRTSEGMHRAFLFGDEATDSTGKISIGTVLSGISTIRGRQNPHWLILDEPDVGVGEGYRHAIGEYLAEASRDLPSKTLGLIVITHAREIAGPMMEAGASSIRVGDDLRPVREWLAHGDLPKSIEDLQSLSSRVTQRFRDVERTIREGREAPTAQGPRR